jgi:hypothetical protein
MHEHRTLQYILIRVFQYGVRNESFTMKGRTKWI